MLFSLDPSGYKELTDSIMECFSDDTPHLQIDALRQHVWLLRGLGQVRRFKRSVMNHKMIGEPSEDAFIDLSERLHNQGAVMVVLTREADGRETWDLCRSSNEDSFDRILENPSLIGAAVEASMMVSRCDSDIIELALEVVA